MKLSLLKIIVFLKRPSIIYRIVAIPLAFYVIFFIAIPDIQFNLASDKPVELTLDQLFKTPKADLPRYLKIKDAVVPSGSYVYETGGKSNSLKGIYYPVYPDTEVVSNFSASKMDSIQKGLAGDSTAFKIAQDSTGKLLIVQNTDNIEAKLIIHDTHVKDSDLNDSTGNYFDSPTFSIEGQYNGDALSADTKSLFMEEGIKISNDAILLKRGDKAMETITAIFVILAGLLLAFLCALTFVPANTLVRWAGLGDNWEQIQLSEASNAVPLPDSVKIAPFWKRAFAYVIDYLIILGITYAVPNEVARSFMSGIGIAFIYFTVLDIILKGSSIGKLLVKQKVSTIDKTLPIKEILIRNVVKSICNVFPPIFFYALANTNNQTLHDLAAKTYVIEKTKESRAI